MMDISPSKSFMEKMKTSQGKETAKKHKFGRKKKKAAAAKKGFMKFAKPAADDQEEMDEMA